MSSNVSPAEGLATAASARSMGGSPPSASDIPRRTLWLVRGFEKYTKGYVAKNFHAVRLSRSGYLPGPDETLSGPLLVALNHPSWWDPLIGLVLATRFWPDRAHYAPIEADGLAKYRFLERLGFFGVEPGSARGARAFLRQSLAILSQPGSMVWLTAQGRFVDPRERPVQLKEGVGHLAHRLRAGYVLPMALEYPFWTERTPEALVRFGTPLSLEASAPGRPVTPAAWTERIAMALQEAQDGLEAEALGRDPATFETVLGGRVGVGGVYDGWRRLKAAIRGERFDGSHGG